MWTRVWVAVLGAVAFVSCGEDESPRGGARFAGPGVAGAAGTAGESSTTSCSPARCPVAPDAEACCVTPEGPCGLARGNVCEITRPPMPRVDAGEAGPEPLTCESARVAPPGSFCTHSELCRAACSSVGGPCGSVEAFERFCVDRWCAATRDMAIECAECVIGGLGAEYRCQGQCACDVAFLSTRSRLCADRCRSRLLAPCGADEACGNGAGTCKALCGEMAVCADPDLPTCSCNGGAGECPNGSTCVCGCLDAGVCSRAAPRARLCAQPYADCFDCSDLPEAGSGDGGGGQDATAPESGVVDRDAEARSDGGTARDAEMD
jgi:hypothetical protein